MIADVVISFRIIASCSYEGTIQYSDPYCIIWIDNSSFRG